ncbi:hypothetical protein PM082_017017 [Marasmius tenuissimus]|nr:hypothetical protein PM082_017017 [Marasmius tenuissimus]
MTSTGPPCEHYELPELPRSSSTVAELLEPPTPSRANSDVTDIAEATSGTTGLLNESSLPPVDGGFGAWSFLIAAFLIEGVVWSFPGSFGIFLDAYNSDSKYTQQSKASLLLPLIGPLGSGIMYCSGPIIIAFMDRYPHFRRLLMWCGVPLCGASLLGASYTTRVPLLVFLQGIVYALGGVFLYYPCISYLPEWFLERRGMANGAIFAGTALGGVILPLVLPPMISSYGPQKTLRFLSIAITSLLLPVLPFAKGRLPELRSRVTGPEPRGTARGWLRKQTFWLIICVNTLQGFGHFVPILWMPSFATALQIKPAKASIALSMLNGSSFLSGLALGYLSDKWSPWLLAVTSLAFTSLVTFVLWGIFSTTFGGLLAFGIVYGLLAGGWSSLWSSFIRPFVRDDPKVVTLIFGYLGLSRGIGNILSTPISSALSTHSNISTEIPPPGPTGFSVDDGRYEKMILYAGSCFAGAALFGVIGWVSDRKVRSQETTRLDD